MAELVENEPLYSLLSRMKNSKLSRGCVILFGCRTGKTGNLVVPTSEQQKPYLLVLWTQLVYLPD